MKVTILGFCLAFQTVPLLAHRLPAGRPFSLSNHLPSLLLSSCHPWFRWQTLGGSLLGQESWEQSYHPKEAPLRPACLCSLSATQWQTTEGSLDHCVDNSVCGFAVETMKDCKARGQLKKQKNQQERHDRGKRWL